MGLVVSGKTVRIHTSISPQKLPLWVPAQKGFLDTSRRVPTFRRRLPPSGHPVDLPWWQHSSLETSVQFYQITRWHVSAGSSHHLENLVSPKVKLVQYPKENFSLPCYDPVNRSSLLSSLLEVCRSCGWKRWLRIRGLAATNKRSWKKIPKRLKVKYLIILWHVIARVCEMLTGSILSWLARDVHAHAYTPVCVTGFTFPIPCSTIQ